MFLIPKDYRAIIRSEIRNAIANDQEYNVEFSEMAARSVMEDHLRQRFDVSKIFPEVLPFSETEQYETDALVYFPTEAAALADQKVYKAKQAITNGELPGETNSEFWEPKDPRHPSIKLYLLDLTIYHLYAAAPVIPQVRVDRYDAAMKWLEKVLKGEITPDLPAVPEPLPEADQSSLLRFGSGTKLRHER